MRRCDKRLSLTRQKKSGRKYYAPSSLIRLFWHLSSCRDCGARLPRRCASSAQTWPTRPVRFIVPLGPGSGVDITARLFADKLSRKWGQPVVVENKPGGDAFIAITAVITAHDDHMLLFAPASTFTAHPLLHDKLPYKPKDLVPIARVTNTLIAVGVPTELGVSTRQGIGRQDQSGARQAELCLGHRRQRSAVRRLPQDRKAGHGESAVQGPGGRRSTISPKAASRLSSAPTRSCGRACRPAK